ncbi:hypothetical protein [Pseudalkalibacillus hwajinpoensis]|uniref:Uncharacterized protein n=1 Tax=Guptibacillus hwajinpoensis TaxID=208199 RepID=A0A4U1MH63_9BACL|nr:hypothetical protein [Pseudalkalibacillus hwajinpoensis]TKD70303.1 hypothetical protein FBF83_13790 [Pseudalkalibacillus hwajinpoensis]
MQYVLALIGGGLLLLILTLVPMGLSIVQKTLVAGMASALSILLLVFKVIYPLPLAIILVLLCASILMYVIWKKANVLFVNVADEMGVAMHIENEPVSEKKESFRNKLIKEREEYDDNSSNRETDESEEVMQEEEEKYFDDEMNHELLLKLEEIEDHEELKAADAKPVLEEVDSAEEFNLDEHLNLYTADQNDEEESSEELIELEEIEEIDFSARMETVYEENDEEEELESFFDDFIREAEQEQLQQKSETETAGTATSLLEQEGDHSSSEQNENQFENRLEEIEDLNDRVPILFEVEKNGEVKQIESEDTLKPEEDESLILEDALNEMLETTNEIEQVGNETEFPVETKTEEVAVDQSSEKVATQMLSLLHEQARNYKEIGYVSEYEKMVDQLLTSNLDDVMYFSIAAEYRSHLIESGQWAKVEKLLSEMEDRCKYPLLLEEIRYLQSMIKNKMMK